MSERVPLWDIKSGAEHWGNNAASFWCPDVLALVEAVEAAQKFVHHTYHSRGSVVNTSGHGVRLKDALARLDFGDANVLGGEDEPPQDRLTIA